MLIMNFIMKPIKYFNYFVILAINFNILMNTVILFYLEYKYKTRQFL